MKHERKGAGDFFAELAADPEYQQAKAKRDADRLKREKAFGQLEAPLVKELRGPVLRSTPSGIW